MTAGESTAQHPPVRRPRALREAHAHIAHHGRAMSMSRFDGCPSLSACLEQVARDAGASEGWLLGIGLRTESWPERRYPTRVELDDAAGGRPVALWSFDHHALAASTAALAHAGLTRASPDPEHGRIIRDERGEPTGLLLERAAKLLWESIPEPSPAQWKAHIRDALGHLRALGFVEVHDLLSQPWLGPLLAELHDEGGLPCRVLLYPPMADFEGVLRTREDWERPGLALAGAKVFADGTLNSRTAWMLSAYRDPLRGLPRGQPMLKHEQLHGALVRVQAAGLGLAVHAIGDAAVRMVIDVYASARSPRDAIAERTFRPLGAPDRAGAGFPALRLEHAEIIDEADIPRLSASGIVVSLQPCHLLTDVEALERSLPDRLGRVLPIRDLIEAGLTPGRRLLFGSDTPIVRPEPEDSIAAATLRRRPGDPPGREIAPEQGIRADQAWACFGAE